MATTAEVTNLRTRRENWTKGGPVVSNMDETEIAALEDRTTATVADPVPMGLWALATGTWILGTVIAGVFPNSAFTATIPILLVFGGIAQFIAGLFAYRRANVLAATTFCSFGAFYVTAAFYFALQAANTLDTAGNALVIRGFMFESFAFIALALAAAATRTNTAMVAVLSGLFIGYALAGIPDLAAATGQPGWTIISAIGGYVLCAAALVAYYTGAAFVVNSTCGRTALPIGGEA